MRAMVEKALDQLVKDTEKPKEEAPVKEKTKENPVVEKPS